MFPTKEETEGIPILEACACKTTSIVRDIPVFNGWLKDGVNVYKAKSLKEFEEKIRKIMNKEVSLSKEEIYEVAKERSLDKIGEKLKEVYESVYKK